MKEKEDVNLVTKLKPQKKNLFKIGQLSRLNVFFMTIFELRNFLLNLNTS